QASGSGSAPAILTGTANGPFALRPGMTLTVTTDNRVPVTVRFLPGDFADMGGATAGEVAAALNRSLSELKATAPANGPIVLTSHTVGPDSALQVDQEAASLVTLEGATRGRLSAFADPTARLRLFSETSDPEAPASRWAAQQVLAGRLLPTGLAPGGLPPG